MVYRHGGHIEGAYYYFNNSGHKLTGWIQVDGTYYYLNPSDKGRMAANTTLKIDGISYTFAANGACTTSGGNALNVNGNTSGTNNTTAIPGSNSSNSSAPGSSTASSASPSASPGSTSGSTTPGSSSSNQSNNKYVSTGPATGQSDPSFNGRCSFRKHEPKQLRQQLQLCEWPAESRPDHRSKTLRPYCKTKTGMRDAHSHFCFQFSYEKNSLFTALKIPRMEDRVMLELTPTPYVTLPLSLSIKWM